MTISTSISGYWKRFNDDNLELNRRISEDITVTEYGGNRIAIAAGSTGISIRPNGVSKITALYIESDGKINVEMTGAMTASINMYTNGILAFMNASLSDLKLSNRTATPVNVFSDVSG